MIRKIWHISFVFAWLLATAGSPADVYNCGRVPESSQIGRAGSECDDTGNQYCNGQYCGVAYENVLMPGNCHNTVFSNVNSNAFIPSVSDPDIHTPVHESLFTGYPSDTLYAIRSTGILYRINTRHGLQAANHAIQPFLQVFLF